MMYKCLECGAEFLEPEITHDMIPYGSSYVQGPAQEECPFCGGDFEQAQTCELCGNSFTESNHANVCPSCINIVANRFSETLKANFTPFEIAILNSVYDGGIWSE